MKRGLVRAYESQRGELEKVCLVIRRLDANSPRQPVTRCAGGGGGGSGGVQSA